MDHCCVIGCNSNFGLLNEDITFHTFPANKSLRNVWIKSIGRQNWVPTADSYICSRHFNSNRFRKNNLLHPMAIPTLLLNNPEIENILQSGLSHEPTVKCQTQHPEIEIQPKLTAAMDKEEWSLQRLESFAAAYSQHEVLYTKPQMMPTYSKRKDSYKHLKPNHKLNEEFALERLAGSLGLPNDHGLRQRCRDFCYQLLRYTRGRMRSKTLKLKDPGMALTGSPPHIVNVATTLDMIRVALNVELSSPGSPVRLWAVHALTLELARAVRRHCGSSDVEPESLSPRVLGVASTFVCKDARPVTELLWVRMCSLRKQQLSKLSLAGDRSAALRPAERLEPCDWELLDALLLHASDEAMPLVTQMSLHWRDSLCALVLLVELLAAEREPPPLAAPQGPPRPRALVWKRVHKRYTATGRMASVVLLQRRWQQLLQMTRGESLPLHPLLGLVATSFPQVIRKPNNPWKTLVQNNLVVTNEDMASVVGSCDIPIENVFAELENCRSITAIEQYIENKVLQKHKIYFNGVLWKNKDNVNAVTVDSSDLSDCVLDDTINILDKDGNDVEEVKDDEKIDEEVKGDEKFDEEVKDDEKLDEYVKPPDECGKNSPNYVEIEIDTSKIVDYNSDVLMEVESLKTLDHNETSKDELDDLKTFKIMKLHEEFAAPTTDFVRYVDGNGVRHHITISKTGKLIINNDVPTLDPKLAGVPRVKLKRIDETRAWRQHARDNRIDVKRSGIIETNDIRDMFLRSGANIRVKQVIILDDDYNSECSIESEREIDAITKYTNDVTSRNPDLNPELKRLSKTFWKKQQNQRLMELCKPAVVKLSMMKESEMPRKGRVVKKVELADIDEVRRINSNILTAQVEPISISKYNDETDSYKHGAEPVQRAREQADRLLAVECRQLHVELKKLFTLSSSFVKRMIEDCIYGDESDERDLEAKTRVQRMNAASPKNESCAGAPNEREQQKIIKNKYFEIGTRRVASRADDDLDEVLRCTIIRKPPAEGAETLDTDVATRPFFVNSGERLVAGDARTAPVITGVCSLAEDDDVILVSDHSTGPPPPKRAVDPLVEAVRRLSKQRERRKREDRSGKAVTRPKNFAVHLRPVVQQKDDNSKTAKAQVPTQRQRFVGSNNELASLTKVLVQDGSTPTVALVSMELPSAPAQLALITGSSLGAQVVPAVSLAAPLSAATSLQFVSALPMTSQVVAAPVSLTNVTQILPTLTMTPQMVPTLTMPTLLPVAGGLNIIGFPEKLDGGRVTLDTNLTAAPGTVKWVEPGRVEPPSALSFNRPVTPQDYMRSCGRDITVVKLDSSKPLWTLADEYLILAEKILPCEEPTYWTLGSPAACTRLLFPDGGEVAPDLVIENVVGNYAPNARPGPPGGRARGDGTVISLSDSDSDGGARRPGALLKVKSFAKCGRAERNALDAPRARRPDVIERADRGYKKLTDEPPLYTVMLSAVSSTEQCDALVRARAALHVWARRAGRLAPLHVSQPTRQEVPARMAGALLVRHADSRFLQDLAGKFQRLNSAADRPGDNQMYVFAPAAV